jgi:hypothetical protein
VMKPLPNSGTAQRNLIAGTLAGTGAVGGYGIGGWEGALAGVAGPAAIGRMLMSRPGQAYLSNQLIGRTPEHNRMLAQILRAQGASAGER